MYLKLLIRDIGLVASLSKDAGLDKLDSPTSGTSDLLGGTSDQ